MAPEPPSKRRQKPGVRVEETGAAFRRSVITIVSAFYGKQGKALREGIDKVSEDIATRM